MYEIMWKNMVELDRTQMTIWRMRMACWIPWEYVILIVFPLQHCLHKRVSMLRHTYIHCLPCFYTYVNYAKSFQTKYKVFLSIIYFFSTDCTVVGRFLMKKMSLALSNAQTKGRGYIANSAKSHT
jgi:hypothetical protein